MNSRTTERYLDDYIGGFIDTLESGHGEASVRFALQNLASSAGFERFAYLDIRAGSSRSYSNHPAEWQQRYLSRNYFALDPVVTRAKRTMRPIVWSHAEKGQYEPKERLFLDEAKAFGIASGITVPIKGGFGRTAMLALASDRTDANRIGVRDVAYAATAVAYVHLSLLRLSTKALVAIDAALSPREITCMVWASMGKTKGETAKMLGITEKTVRFYLERAREKLGAANIAHAVRIAMERDLL